MITKKNLQASPKAEKECNRKLDSSYVKEFYTLIKNVGDHEIIMLYEVLEKRYVDMMPKINGRLWTIISVNLSLILPITTASVV